jgi:hypothetical protein
MTMVYYRAVTGPEFRPAIGCWNTIGSESLPLGNEAVRRSPHCCTEQHHRCLPFVDVRSDPARSDGNKDTVGREL